MATNRPTTNRSHYYVTSLDRLVRTGLFSVDERPASNPPRTMASSNVKIVKRGSCEYLNGMLFKVLMMDSGVLFFIFTAEKRYFTVENACTRDAILPSSVCRSVKYAVTSASSAALETRNPARRWPFILSVLAT